MADDVTTIVRALLAVIDRLLGVLVRCGVMPNGTGGHLADHEIKLIEAARLWTESAP
jgi:hypothetical protein